MLPVVCDVVFHPDFDPHLHRSAEHPIHRGAEDYQISHVDRHPKIQVINCCSDHIVPGVAMGGHGSGEVNPMHEASAQQCAQRIGVVG